MFPFLNKMMLGNSGPLNVDNVFATNLYNATDSIRTLSFAPHFLWDKHRTASTIHFLRDSVRGNFSLDSSSTSTQTTSDTAPNGSSKILPQIGVAGDYVNFAFRRAPKFFDAVVYSGNNVSRQIPHNLGIKPGLFIIKSYSGTTYDWWVYHASRDAGQYYRLNQTTGEAVNSSVFGIEPTSTHFTVGNASGVNNFGTNYIAYLFAHDSSPNGIIQCGQYTGNGSTGGPIITLGWEPQWLLIKRVNSAGSWALYDNKRITTNPRRIVSFANSTGPEVTTTSGSSGWSLDFNETGFQLKVSNPEVNGNGSTYIYMAIRKGLL